MNRRKGFSAQLGEFAKTGLGLLVSKINLEDFMNKITFIIIILLIPIFSFSNTSFNAKKYMEDYDKLASLLEKLNNRVIELNAEFKEKFVASYINKKIKNPTMNNAHVASFRIISLYSLNSLDNARQGTFYFFIYYAKTYIVSQLKEEAVGGKKLGIFFKNGDVMLKKLIQTYLDNYFPFYTSFHLNAVFDKKENESFKIYAENIADLHLKILTEISNFIKKWYGITFDLKKYEKK